ncbi:MAG: hypothetical protein IPM29_07845 [Planctomycetes bacterium]|nr:hypothetical protein [Planctomycetota bacterium]
MRRHATTMAALGGLLLLAVTAVVGWRHATAPVRIATGPADAGPREAAARVPALRAERRPLDGPPAAAGLATGSTGPLDFQVVVERLVELGLELWTAVEEESAAVTAIDDVAEALLRDLLARVADAPERALAELAAYADGSSGERRRTVHFQVLLRIVRDGLADRERRCRGDGHRSALDALASGCLGTLQLGPSLARELGRGTLVDAPYLGAAHEAEVLALFDAGADVPHVAEVAPALLRTLWRNLVDSGARTPGEVASLALLFAADGSPERRRAALAHLLTAAHGRYRSLAVDSAVRSGDAGTITDVADAAVERLRPGAALDVMAALSRADADATTAAFVRFGARHGDALPAAYERSLADGADSRSFRVGLVTAAGLDPRPTSAALAISAFETDPDPGVRERALLALAAIAPPDQVARCIAAALADPVRGRDPQWLGHVAAALRNAAGRLGRAELEPLVERLRARSELAEADRHALMRLTAAATR